MVDELKKAIAQAANNLFSVGLEPELSRPAEQFGDYATNVALQLAGQLDKPPRQIAEQLLPELQKIDGIAKADIAGPGFINFTLTDEKLADAASSATDLPQPLDDQEILVEFGDPNPFKEMHIGHLYSYIVGDAISSLLAANGADVKRLSYHGDVGLHVAKAIWGMQNGPADQSLGKYYAQGAKAYEDNDQTKSEINEINEHVYKQDNPEINKLYEQGKKLSFEDFDLTLDKLGIKTDHRYLESQTAETGLKYVKDNTGKVFKESEGAIIYDGEKVGLHTRVFITSKGLPTYETKDLGLAELKNKDYPSASCSIIITANEQNEYFKVMLAALAEIDPELAKKTTHMSHGFVNLSTGKMSSRTGNVYSATNLLDSVKQTAEDQHPDSNSANKTYLAAVKYGLLKQRLGPDIAYDVEESISLEGNSGPYLQYAHARACSILTKAGEVKKVDLTGLEPAERSLARKISEYPEVVELAAAELMPHHICTYLYELAQTFNRFYEHSKVIGDSRQDLRLKLVRQYANVLKHGLNILNIEAPERM